MVKRFVSSLVIGIVTNVDAYLLYVSVSRILPGIWPGIAAIFCISSAVSS